MPTKPKPPTEKYTAADWSRINKVNSKNSPWRNTPISKRSAKCHEYFRKLAEKGDDRRVPRPELDVE